jgi:hypothetical protein
VPAENEIAGVFVSNHISYAGMPGRLQQVALADVEFISAAREVHQIFLNGRNEIYSVPDFSNHFVNPRYENQVYFHYLLNNGQFVTRRYIFPHSFAENETIDAFLNSAPVILSPYTHLRTPDEIVQLNFQFAVTHYDEETEQWVFGPQTNMTITDRAQINEMVDLVAQGIVENEIQRRAERAVLRDSERQLREMLAQEAADQDQRLITLPELVLLQPWVEVSFGTRDESSLPMLYDFWTTPFIRGDPAMRIIETLYDWGVDEVVFIQR